jgi:GDP-L-fucose synthase
MDDNFNLNTSHVLPALMRKFHEAKINSQPEVMVWGSGTPKREFLFVDDLAEAIVFLLEKVNANDLYQTGITQINIGMGKDLTINELAELIAEVIGFKGKIVYDSSKPDGTPRKLLDVTRINNLGWRAKTDLKTGIQKTYQWYLEKSS